MIRKAVISRDVWYGKKVIYLGANILFKAFTRQESSQEKFLGLNFFTYKYKFQKHYIVWINKYFLKFFNKEFDI